MKPIEISGCIHAAQLDDNSVITITPQIDQWLVTYANPIHGGSDPDLTGWSRGYYYDDPNLVMGAFLALAIGEEPEGWRRKSIMTREGTRHFYPGTSSDDAPDGTM